MKSTEAEDFEKLYRNIENDVLKGRIESAGKWYIEKAILYKRLFYVFNIISIILPLCIAVVNVVDQNAQLLTVIISSLTSFTTALLAFTKWGEKWMLYRNAIESLKSKLTLFGVSNGSQEELQQLACDIEKIMHEEHNKWNYVQNTNSNKKKVKKQGNA